MKHRLNTDENTFYPQMTQIFADTNLPQLNLRDSAKSADALSVFHLWKFVAKIR